MTGVGAKVAMDPVYRYAEGVSSGGLGSSLLAGPEFSIPEGTPRNWVRSDKLPQEELRYLADEADLVINLAELDLRPAREASNINVAPPTPNLSRAPSFAAGTNNNVVATGFAQSLSAALEDVLEDRKPHRSLPSSLSSFTPDEEEPSDSVLESTVNYRAVNYKSRMDRKESDCSTCTELPGVYHVTPPEQTPCDDFFGFGAHVQRMLAWAGGPSWCNVAPNPSACRVEEVLHSSTIPPQALDTDDETTQPLTSTVGSRH